MKVQFDIDGTLIDAKQKPLAAQVRRYKELQAQGHDVGAWSRRGVKYAAKMLAKLGLKGSVSEKGSYKPDVAYDNEEQGLGKKTIKVGIPHGSVQ